ncbi:M28 family peptidase [soil metagenome]
MFRLVFLLLFLAILISCGKKEKPQETLERIVKVPLFNGDSAFRFTEKQIKFGPRIPNTPAHRETGDYFISALKSYGAATIVQEFEAITFDGKKLFLRNIIASYFPEKQKRILIAAHWDTRPFADRDKEKPDSKFDGANDGASGAALLLEIARTLSNNTPPDVGVDLIFFDGEDWGEKELSTRIQPPQGQASWWCLGSQYWSKHKHKPNYSAYYGIVVDMVGAEGSHFFQEGYSLEYAPKIVDKVWGTASRLGYSSLFVRQKGGGAEDDHVYLNELAKIPTIDIISFEPQTGSFGDFHHTTKDNLSIISKQTLGAVGTVLLNVIYYEE